MTTYAEAYPLVKEFLSKHKVTIDKYNVEAYGISSTIYGDDAHVWMSPYFSIKSYMLVNYILIKTGLDIKRGVVKILINHYFQELEIIETCQYKE